MKYKVFMTVGTEQMMNTYSDEVKAIKAFIRCINVLTYIKNDLNYTVITLYKQTTGGEYEETGYYRS